jgi:hypothetical protein
MLIVNKVLLFDMINGVSFVKFLYTILEVFKTQNQDSDIVQRPSTRGFT